MAYTFDRLSPGSRVLVTGATGYIGSSVCVLLLDRGYKVRAATRSLVKAEPFRQILQEKYGADAVQLAEIKDFNDTSTLDKALIDVQGVVHLATDASFSPKFESVVPTVVQWTESILAAVTRAPQVRSVVLTSSRIAAFAVVYGQDTNASANDWADYFVDMAKAVKADDPMAPVLVYAASKLAGERKAWEYAKRTKHHFTFNVILPDYVAGPLANTTTNSPSTHSFLNELFQGVTDGPAVTFMSPASHLVDVRDVAVMHVAALTESKLDGQRLWAAPHKFTIDKILAVWRGAFPDKKFPADFANPNQPDVNIDDEASTALLTAFKGTSWTPFEETILANVHDVK